jgi:hypothetical protein
MFTVEEYNSSTVIHASILQRILLELVGNDFSDDESKFIIYKNNSPACICTIINDEEIMLSRYIPFQKLRHCHNAKLELCFFNYLRARFEKKIVFASRSDSQKFAQKCANYLSMIGFTGLQVSDVEITCELETWAPLTHMPRICRRFHNVLSWEEFSYKLGKFYHCFGS